MTKEEGWRHVIYFLTPVGKGDMAPKRETTVILTVCRYGRPYQRNLQNNIRKREWEITKLKKMLWKWEPVMKPSGFCFHSIYVLFIVAGGSELCCDKCFVYTRVTKERTDIRVCSVVKLPGISLYDIVFVYQSYLSSILCCQIQSKFLMAVVSFYLCLMWLITKNVLYTVLCKNPRHPIFELWFCFYEIFCEVMTHRLVHYRLLHIAVLFFQVERFNFIIF